MRPNGQPTGWCKLCKSAYNRARYLADSDKIKAQARAWSRANPERKARVNKEYRQANPDRMREKSAAWVARNLEKRREIWRRSYAANRAKADAASKKWMDDHPHHVRERARRLKTGRKQCLATWADMAAIVEIYAKAAALTQETGVPHEVDHIVPLTSKLVCGLHWEGNLQILPRSINRAKSNRLEV